MNEYVLQRYMFFLGLGDAAAPERLVSWALPWRHAACWGASTGPCQGPNRTRFGKTRRKKKDVNIPVDMLIKFLRNTTKCWCCFLAPGTSWNNLLSSQLGSLKNYWKVYKRILNCKQELEFRDVLVFQTKTWCEGWSYFGCYDLQSCQSSARPGFVRCSQVF